MQRRQCSLGLRALLLLTLAAALGPVPGPAPLHAAQPQGQLQLDVVINGVPANMIGSFTLFPGGIIGATRAELEALGLRTDAARTSADMVLLHELPTVRYVYEERTQRIRITLDDAYRMPHVYDLRHGANDRVVRPEVGWGLAVNYDLFSSLSSAGRAQSFGFSGTSLTLDGRAFSPFGTFEQSGIASLSENHDTQSVRLDSSYRYSDTGRLVSYTAGDIVSGGLPWTRPIRIGGVQADRNFALRPDLVTMPLPNLGGTAAVPSTLDVYVNSIRTFSQEVGTGPFSLTNIPTVTGAGNAQVVVRDSSGRETTTNIPFYGSAALLAPGLMSWSVETGLPRISFGSTGDRYGGEPVASVTWRQGMLDWFTAEGHAEGSGSVANGGGGGAARIGTSGVLTAAVGGSTRGSGKGAQVAASFETQLCGVVLDFSSQHTFGDYEDLASVTAQQQAFTFFPSALDAVSSGNPGTTRLNQQIYGNAHAPRALDRITVGGPLFFDAKSSWGLSFVHQQDASNNVSKLASASYTRVLPYDATVFVAAYKDVGSVRSTGALVGLSVPLGQSATASASAASAAGGAIGTIQASRALDPEPGSFGWQALDSEGGTPYRQGAVAYRSSVMTVEAAANRSGSAFGGSLEASGAVAAMGGGIFFSDRIYDAFAVVDAGAPNVAVSYENRPIGTTDSHGLLLVPTLRSYQRNQISIDPSNLPVDAEIATTREIVTPGDRAGALVSVRVQNDRAAALLIFVRPGGGFVPAGRRGRLEGGDEFVVGYDGQAFIKNLAGANRVAIDFGDAVCHAAFGFQPRPGEQVRIGPVTCQ